MRRILCLSVLALGLGLSAQTFACETLDDGYVSQIEGTKLIVAKGDTKTTFTTADKTTVTINGKAAALADIKAGDKVTVDYESATDVLAIKVTRES